MSEEQARQDERAAVVKWLRGNSKKFPGTEYARWTKLHAEAIERGHHLTNQDQE